MNGAVVFRVNQNLLEIGNACYPNLILELNHFQNFDADHLANTVTSNMHFRTLLIDKKDVYDFTPCHGSVIL